MYNNAHFNILFPNLPLFFFYFPNYVYRKKNVQLDLVSSEYTYNHSLCLYNLYSFLNERNKFFTRLLFIVTRKRRLEAAFFMKKNVFFLYYSHSSAGILKFGFNAKKCLQIILDVSGSSSTSFPFVLDRENLP